MEIALVDDMNYDRDKLYQIISYYLNIKKYRLHYIYI